MAIICMAVHDTDENGRSKYTKETLYGLINTVNFSKNRLFITDNGSCHETLEIYASFLSNIENLSIQRFEENKGTAAAINQGIKTRKPNEVVIKIDNDVVVHSKGWVEELEETILDNPNIGILGLKRDDIWQNTTHENPDYRTYMEGNIEICDDIMGTCTAFNPLLLDKLSFMNQCSPYYGADDVLFSARSLAAGFKNAFLPHIKITHLDEGGTEYTEWKKREAGKYLLEAASMCAMYRTGKLPVYYDGGF